MEIPVDLSGVNLEWIGQGASGSIFLIDSFEPAILLKHITTRADTRRNEFLIEVETLKRLNHPNIVKYLGIGKFKRKRTNIWAQGILLEYCERGALCHLIDNPTIIYTIYNVVSWTRQLIKALGYLAENRVVHRDIKPAKTRQEHEIGFRALKAVEQKLLANNEECGDPFVDETCLCALSKLGGTCKLSHRSDVYSMGLVIWEMIERRKVFDRFGSHYDYGLFATEERQLIDVEVLECEHGIRFIVEKCTIFDVNKRSRVSELMVEIEDLYKQDEDAILMNVKPIDSPLETRLIKPIGFDRTKRRVSVGHSDLFNIEIVYENTQNSVNSVQSQASTSAQAFVENSSQILATMEQILEENKEIRFLQQKTLQHIEAQQQKMQDFELKLDQLQNQEQKTREKVEHHERTFYNKGAPTGYPAGILDSGYPKNATTSNEYFCENYEDRKCMVSTSDRLTPPLQSDDLIRYASSGNCTHPPQTKTSNSHYNASPRTPPSDRLTPPLQSQFTQYNLNLLLSGGDSEIAERIHRYNNH